jgi:hypothetical protein
MIPAYATISHSAGIWSVTYLYWDSGHGSGESCHSSGYGPDVFDGLPDELPLIRCDLATVSQVLEGIRGPCGVVECDGAYFGRELTLAQYLEKHSRAGVPVSTIGAWRKETA